MLQQKERHFTIVRKYVPFGNIKLYIDSTNFITHYSKPYSSWVKYCGEYEHDILTEIHTESSVDDVYHIIHHGRLYPVGDIDQSSSQKQTIDDYVIFHSHMERLSRLIMKLNDVDDKLIEEFISLDKL